MISICEFHAGNARNVIPQTAELRGTVRTLTPEVRELVEKRVREVVRRRGADHRRQDRSRSTSAAIPSPSITPRRPRSRRGSRRKSPATANVHEMPPMMGAEDFAYMLEARPGAFIFCGNGDSAGLHHPAYNFNDEAIVYGTSYWIKLVENTLAA